MVLRLWTNVQSRTATNEDGASLVEYALLLTLIALVAIVAVRAVGTQVESDFTDIADELTP